MSPCVVAEGDNTVLSLSVGKVLLMYLNKGKYIYIIFSNVIW